MPESASLTEFDEMIDRLGYNRSKAIQVATRGFLIMIYDQKTRGLEEILTNIQHGYRTLISSTTRLHLDERNCPEIVAVKGRAKAIHTPTEKPMTVKGVKQLKLATLMF